MGDIMELVHKECGGHLSFVSPDGDDVKCDKCKAVNPPFETKVLAKGGFLSGQEFINMLSKKR